MTNPSPQKTQFLRGTLAQLLKTQSDIATVLVGGPASAKPAKARAKRQAPVQAQAHHPMAKKAVHAAMPQDKLRRALPGLAAASPGAFRPAKAAGKAKHKLLGARPFPAMRLPHNPFRKSPKPASLSVKGKPAMKARLSRHPAAYAILVLLLAVGGFGLYRSMRMPKVHVKHVASAWLDKSAGKRPIAHHVVHTAHVQHHHSAGSHTAHKHKAKHHGHALAKHKKKHKHHKAIASSSANANVQTTAYHPAQ